MHPAVTVRPRTDADLPELSRVLLNVHRCDGYPVEGVADPIAWLTPPRLLKAWTADHDARPVGHAAVTRAIQDDDAAQAWSRYTGESIDELAIPVRLFVDPDSRRRGVARMLIQAVQDYGHDHGLALAFDVMLKDKDAIRIYEAIGCIRLDTITHRHSEPAVVYSLPTLVDHP